MRLLILPALSLSLLASCVQQPVTCDNQPICFGPNVTARNNEIQPDPVQINDLVVAAGESQAVTVMFHRNGLPENLPVSFPAVDGYYPGENVGGEPQQSQQARGTLLYERGGLTLRAAANPFTGSSTQLTVSVAPQTPAGNYGFQVFLQKENTKYGSSRALFFGVKVP